MSLLTSLTHEDIQALQSVERGQDFILKNDYAASWAHVRTLDKARFDIVLDNVSSRVDNRSRLVGSADRM